MGMNTWIGEAREIAAQCWCDEETRNIPMNVALVEAVAWRIAVWMETQAQCERNAAYYRGLLDRCAEHLGPGVFECDDGTIADEPLRAKIPELVAKLAAGGK